jgi:colicin import membrane protein
MPKFQTRRNRPRNEATLAAIRQRLRREQEFKAHRMRQKITSANIAAARRTMNAVRRALTKASRNNAMGERRTRTRTRPGGNNVGMATRRSARIATAAAEKAIKEKKAAVNAALKAAALEERKLKAAKRKKNAEDAKKAAAEAKKEILRAQLEAEEAEESAERQVNEAQKKLNAAANARKAGTPERVLSTNERSKLNSLAAELGKMRLK